MIAYRTGNDLELDAVIDVYVDSTLGERHPHPARRARRREVLPHIGFQHHPQAWILRGGTSRDAG